MDPYLLAHHIASVLIAVRNTMSSNESSNENTLAIDENLQNWLDCIGHIISPQKKYSFPEMGGVVVDVSPHRKNGNVIDRSLTIKKKDNVSRDHLNQYTKKLTEVDVQMLNKFTDMIKGQDSSDDSPDNPDNPDKELLFLTR
eukprot:scaffold66314_cov24-Tisochrysis_lutea.AAC.1